MPEVKLLSTVLCTALLVVAMGWLSAFAPVELLMLTLTLGMFVLSVLHPKVCFILLVLLTPWSPALSGMMSAAAQGAVGLPLTLFEVLSLAAWVAFLVRLPKLKKVDMPRSTIIHLSFVIWLMVSAVIATAGGYDPTRLLRNVIVFSTLFPFAAFMRSGVVRLSQSERVYLQLSVLVMGLAALFVLAPLMGQRHGGVEIISQFAINRIDGWFNVFVFVYILCIILGEKVNSVFRPLITWASLFGVIFSLGRSFWLAAFGVVAYVGLMSAKQNRWLIAAGSALSIFVFQSLGLAQERFRLGAASLQYRFYEQAIIFSEVFHGSIFALLAGRGLAAPIPEVLAEQFVAEYVWWVHNEWLLIVYNAGLIGVLFYALFLLTLTLRINHLAPRLVGLALLLTSIGAGQLLSIISGPWIALACYSFYAGNVKTTT